MADYATEEQQVEALKRWWQENGRAVVFGVSLGALVLAGWRGWEWHTERQALNASTIYDQIIAPLNQADYEAVAEKVETLREEYPRTVYASLGALAAARVAVDEDDLAAAEQWLRWALDNASQDHIGYIARGRLARVVAARGDVEAGLSLLDAELPSAYSALYAEIRGDLLVRREDYQGAAAAYRQALDAGVPPPDPALVERKLNRVRARTTPAESTEPESPTS